MAAGPGYANGREALDAIDRLAAVCGMRLGAVGRERRDASLLATRFLATLNRHRATRDDARRRLALPAGVDPATQVGAVDGDLAALRQALDDLMVAYAEGLPLLGDASLVSRLAADMVEVSRLRTVVDLWAEAEAA